jgi:ubiquinone biosynthesis monooxygenase Coq6
VRYEADECGIEALGIVVENKVLLASLELAMGACGVERICSGVVSRLKTTDTGVLGSLASISVECASNDPYGNNNVGTFKPYELLSRLVVAADGPKSAIRSLAKIRDGGWGYGQRAVCGTVQTSEKHSTAWQRFLPTGPIALLPIGDGRYSSVVWTTTPEEAKRLTEDVSPDEFAREVGDALQGRGPYAFRHQDNLNRYAMLRFVEDTANQSFKPLGRKVMETLRCAVGIPGIPEDDETRLDFAPMFKYPPEIIIEGNEIERGSFPLSTHHAMHLTQPRLALIGDAAHVVHPLGGQGLNLGLSDAELIANAITDAVASGQDIGSVNTLIPYARASTVANAPMMVAIDGIQKLFSAATFPIVFSRSIGLATVNAIGPLRRQIARYAMGIQS